jgi:hypothetical protein
MRRLTTIILAVPVMAAALAACGDEQSDQELLRESATSTVAAQGQGTPQNNVPTDPATTADATAEPVVVPLTGDVTGTVTLLTAGERRTRVTVAVEGAAGPLAAEIVRGSCGDDEARGSTKAELTDVRDGQSDTEVLVPAQSLLGDHVVLVRTGADQTSPVAGCAELDDDGAATTGTTTDG